MDRRITLHLIQGDCLEVLHKMPTDSVDIVLTSPPYNMGKIVKYSKRENSSRYNIGYKDNLKKEEYYEFLWRFFPIWLPKKIISTFTKEYDTVLDPFLGSGSTMLACLELNRNCIGIEKNPEFIEVCKRRLNWGSCFKKVNWIFEKR